MKEHPEPFDQYLRESFKGHRLIPSDEARKAFLQEAAATVPAGKKWYKWYYLPALLVLIFSAVSVIYFTYDEEPSGISGLTENQDTRPFPDQIIPETINESEPTSASMTVATAQDAASDKIIITENQPVAYREMPALIKTGSEKEPLTEKEKALKKTTVIVEKEGLEEHIPATPAPTEQSDTHTVDTLLAGATADNSAATGSAAGSAPDSLSFEDTDNPVDRYEESITPVVKEEYFLSGLTYTPELLFNTLEGNKFINNFGVEVAFGYGKISVRTGAGISVSKGIVENEIEYNSYLGTYNRLDSISFTFNETFGDFIPELYMSTVDAWDDDASFDSLEIVRRYTYLQIPLTLGFDFLQKEKFSAGVRIGTTMSVMLDSKQLTGNYEPGRNIVIGTSRLTPDRVRTTWLATAGISGTAMLTKRILLEIEPQARYYYGSIYEASGNVKKPWSVGLRAAIYYKF